MRERGFGTCPSAPQPENLIYSVDLETTERICCKNRHYAEFRGYAVRKTSWLEDVSKKGEVTYYDPISFKPLFIAPRGRTFGAFIIESYKSGWPSFRDEEVVWENVRALKNGETISVDGTHLGHNLPDAKGNRYCINLVCVAGKAPLQ